MPKIITTKNVIIVIAIIALLTMTPTKSIAEIIIAKFEGKRLQAYQDSGGIWTIGYGSIQNLDTGQPIKAGDQIDDATALRWLKAEVGTKMKGVKKLVTVPINQNQLDSLTSFSYNVGLGAFRLSTLLRLLNEGKPKIEVANQFLRWNKVNGVIVTGLTNRRKLEMDLFLK